MFEAGARGAGRAAVQNPSADRCIAMQLAGDLLCNYRNDPGNQMNTMAPTRPTALRRHRVPLTAGPASAAEARGQVRAAICTWDVPVDPSVAVLLTSELVTNAIRHEAGETVTLAITCSCGQLRVDVHDTSCSMPVLVDAP